MQILQTIWTALTTENENIINIITLPLSFIEAYFSMLLFTTFFKINASTKSKLLYVSTFSILGYIIRILLPDPIGTILNLTICPILIILIFKVSLIKAVFSEIFPVFICAIIDLILFKSFSIIFNITSNDAIYVPVYRIIFSIFEYTLLYFCYLVINHFNIKISFQKSYNSKYNNILTITTILGIITILIQMYICVFYVKVLPLYIIISSLSTLIPYFIISIYSLFSTNKLNIAKQNLEETKLMNKTLTILNDKIRAFRHDFNNIIQALGGYIQAKDIDGLEKYYSQLLKDCQEVTNLSGLNPESINNPAIYSLLASKYYLATEKGIEFNLDIFMDLNSIDMKIYEFCRILGILLDNAIQATQECEEKHITVTIRKDNRCKRQLLIVENTYKEKDIDTEKIFEKGYSTKEGNTGLGLWEVRQILLKNTNLNLFTSKDDTYFKQQLEIYKN